MTITSSTVEPGIVAVTVDFPPVNAIPSRGWFELADAITAAGRDMATHVVILRAEGRGFNAGVDIKEMQRTSGFTALIDANRGCFAAFKAVYECAVPVVAAVNGYALGGGCELALASDIIIAGEGAQFGLPEVRSGILPGAGGTQRLVRALGKHQAMRMLLTGDRIDARQAMGLGLASQVVADPLVVPTAMALAARIAGALVPQRTRTATRATRASQRRRVEAKKRRGDVKRQRRRPGHDD